MDLNLLATFVVVAETSSFSAAARKLGVMRSSISRSIAALERQLDVQLFNRTTRRVALTSAGRSFLTQVAPQLASLSEALGALPGREELPSGPLRVTAPLDIGALLLPEVLTAFSMRYPSIQVDMRLSNRNVDLVADGVDVALRVMRPRRGDSSLVARKLTEIEMNVFASPLYLARAGTPKTVDDAGEHAWVTFTQRSFVGPLAPLAKVTPRWTGDDVMFLANAVGAGVGLGLLPAYLLRARLTAGAVVRVLPRVSVSAGALYVVYAPTRRLPSKVAALRDFLVEHFATHPLATASFAP